MRATLVLLFAVGVSSMKLSGGETSHMNETQNYKPLYITMIDNMMDSLIDMKNEMVKQPCQETTRSAMPEDDSAHMDAVGPRSLCHMQLTRKWRVCRRMCENLPFTQLISCRNNNWFNYLNACFGGKDIMICVHPTKPAVPDKVVTDKDEPVKVEPGKEECKEKCKENCEAKDNCLKRCKFHDDTYAKTLCNNACDNVDEKRCMKECPSLLSQGKKECVTKCGVTKLCKLKCLKHLTEDEETACIDDCDTEEKVQCKKDMEEDREICEGKC